MRLFLSGPMRGRPEFGRPEFRTAAAHLRFIGHDVVDPHDLDALDGWNWSGHTGTEDLDAIGFDLRRAMRRCHRTLIEWAEGTVLLPGWTSSRGSRSEFLVAVDIGLPTFEYRHSPELPWDLAPDPLVRIEAEAHVELSTIRVVRRTSCPCGIENRR